ncbi:unnamed protein product [Calypogeia fissa]
MREATYLASVYPQVFLDFVLAIPKLTVRGMKSAVAELLELAPINKARSIVSMESDVLSRHGPKTLQGPYDEQIDANTIDKSLQVNMPIPFDAYVQCHCLPFYPLLSRTKALLQPVEKDGLPIYITSVFPERFEHVESLVRPALMTSSQGLEDTET